MPNSSFSWSESWRLAWVCVGNKERLCYNKWNLGGVSKKGVLFARMDVLFLCVPSYCLVLHITTLLNTVVSEFHLIAHLMISYWGRCIVYNSRLTLNPEP